VTSQARLDRVEGGVECSGVGELECLGVVELVGAGVVDEPVQAVGVCQR
jgi:hypothetical protein